jgi:hypothetical protein
VTADADTAAFTPLAMARDWANRVHQIAAHYQQRDREDPRMGPIEAHIHGAGKAQFEAGQMASFMALVSLAEDVHELRRVMLGDAWHDADTVANTGAVDDARATREHMRGWVAGEQHHDGEAD